MYSGDSTDHDLQWQPIAECTLPAEPGHERDAVEQVERMIQLLNLATDPADRCTLAVSEAYVSAANRAGSLQSGGRVTLRVFAFSARETPAPSAGSDGYWTTSQADRTPRGWGFFLIEKAPEVALANDGTDASNYVIELFLYIEGER